MLYIENIIHKVGALMTVNIMPVEPVYSIVIPVYNEQYVIYTSYKRISEVMDTLNEPYELLFVDDGSTDETANVIKSLSKTDANVRLLSFSRNFGHQAAVSAGIDHSLGEAVIIIDVDLQDPPEIIPDMIELWQKGYEVVYGQRKKREGDSWLKEWSAKVFYRLLQRIADVEIPVDTGDFRLVDRKVCNASKQMGERNKYMRGLVSWVGFQQIALEYERDPRFAGETKYPLRKMINLAMDGLAADEYLREFTVVFGQVPAGFRAVEQPRLYVDVLNASQAFLPNGMMFANRADVGGRVPGSQEWIISNATWSSTVFNPVRQRIPQSGW